MAKQIYYHRLRQQQKRQRCNELVVAMLGAEMAPKWWVTSNQAFDQQTPESVFDKNPDQVYSYLTQCAKGGW